MKKISMILDSIRFGSFDPASYYVIGWEVF